ncbi:hypothetical protein Dda_0351 [Drechslerella dactyloides]|uniref:Uncharacterized protein n=1 Tax=Drechslerella dactyloides TaxID=74499 RepID=A0AAD6J450_DREDA|nr:hypothetical protein Dda_0351 [Drechslerella dactyloides]
MATMMMIRRRRRQRREGEDKLGNRPPPDDIKESAFCDFRQMVCDSLSSNGPPQSNIHALP